MKFMVVLILGISTLSFAHTYILWVLAQFIMESLAAHQHSFDSEKKK